MHREPELVLQHPRGERRVVTAHIGDPSNKEADTRGSEGLDAQPASINQCTPGHRETLFPKARWTTPKVKTSKVGAREMAW